MVTEPKELTSDERAVWTLLNEVPDPEIPVLSITDLGIVRNIELKDNCISITITPTYSGCPAMDVFKNDIVEKLEEAGYTDIQIDTVYDPPWTTDWINDAALQRLKEYGIAPPERGTQDKGILFHEGPKVVHCPKCNSGKTHLVSQFGSTACKAMYQCDDCLEPFEYFKCI